jgi:hypothetical protein
LKNSIRLDFGIRLHKNKNDMTLAGLALHPTFKGIVVNPIGIPNSLQTENNRENIFTFFLDLKPKLKLALAATFERLKIAEQPPAVPVQSRSAFSRHIPSLPAVVSADGRDQQSAQWLDQDAEWLDDSQDSATECKRTVLEYWEKSGHRYPALAQLARAVLPAQASGAHSERVWSAADDLCGGDRSNMKPETLDCAVKLRMNTPVRAQCEGVSLFDALTKGE